MFKDNFVKLYEWYLRRYLNKFVNIRKNMYSQQRTIKCVKRFYFVILSIILNFSNGSKWYKKREQLRERNLRGDKLI